LRHVCVLAREIGFIEFPEFAAVTNHARRFSMPLEFAAVGVAGMKSAQAAAGQSTAVNNVGGGTSLAQIYAFARQQAVAEIEGRKWRELMDRIMQ
jgi:hypothetical protein